jgi:hypothetical protein
VDETSPHAAHDRLVASLAALLADQPPTTLAEVATQLGPEWRALVVETLLLTMARRGATVCGRRLRAAAAEAGVPLAQTVAAELATADAVSADVHRLLTTTPCGTWQVLSGCRALLAQSPAPSSVYAAFLLSHMHRTLAAAGSADTSLLDAALDAAADAPTDETLTTTVCLAAIGVHFVGRKREGEEASPPLAACDCVDSPFARAALALVAYDRSVRRTRTRLADYHAHLDDGRPDDALLAAEVLARTGGVRPAVAAALRADALILLGRPGEALAATETALAAADPTDDRLIHLLASNRAILADSPAPEAAAVFRAAYAGGGPRGVRRVFLANHLVTVLTEKEASLVPTTALAAARLWLEEHEVVGVANTTRGQWRQARDALLAELAADRTAAPPPLDPTTSVHAAPPPGVTKKIDAHVAHTVATCL